MDSTLEVLIFTVILKTSHHLYTNIVMPVIAGTVIRIHVAGTKGVVSSTNPAFIGIPLQILKLLQ